MLCFLLIYGHISYGEFFASFTDNQVLHLLEHLCLALNDEFRTYLPVILPCFIQVLGDAERFNDYIYVPDILHTLEVFGGQYYFS